jgi:MSHA pilin protein MshA
MKQKGFTLIELVVVIVILGILAAVALPKFVNFKGDAVQARLDGTAGALASASAMNYGKYQISSGASGVVSVTGSTKALACDPVVGLLVGGALPSSTMSIAFGSGTCTAGGTVTCTLSDSADTTKTSTATITCTN